MRIHKTLLCMAFGSIVSAQVTVDVRIERGVAEVVVSNPPADLRLPELARDVRVRMAPVGGTSRLEYREPLATRDGVLLWRWRATRRADVILRVAGEPIEAVEVASGDPALVVWHGPERVEVEARLERIDDRPFEIAVRAGAVLAEPWTPATGDWRTEAVQGQLELALAAMRRFEYREAHLYVSEAMVWVPHHPDALALLAEIECILEQVNVEW